MSDQLKALTAVILLGIAQVSFVIYAHATGWTQPLISSVLFFGLVLYMVVIFWLVQRVRAHKKHSSVSSN
jgi:hypothetical protein